MDIKKQIDSLCKKALLASSYSGIYDSDIKNAVLKSISANLDINSSKIIKKNLIDIKNAHNKNLKESMIDRLVLNKERMLSMQNGLHEIIKIPDTLYKISKGVKQKNGITVAQMRVPLGVIGMIYESRPNVTIDSAGLCIKSGNSVILRGGSESINSNKALMECITKALRENNMNQYMVQLVSTTDRNAVTHLLSKDQYIDVIIPRGGKGLIEKIVSCSKIPTIKHLDGNCHVYLDKSADVKRAVNISINSKTQRYGVCNAMETLLIHKRFSKKHIIEILDKYRAKGVLIRGCKNLKKISSDISLAKNKDWHEEYLSPIIAIKIVDSLDDAINHINKYGSLHTDAIVASDKTVINTFKRLVNSSSVMINTSTRFADGYEYGLGAEIGISTDKLHVRGPVGLEGLTNLKYIVSSQGKLRN